MKNKVLLLVIITVCIMNLYSQNNSNYELKDLVGKWIFMESAQSGPGDVPIYDDYIEIFLNKADGKYHLQWHVKTRNWRSERFKSYELAVDGVLAISNRRVWWELEDGSMYKIWINPRDVELTISFEDTYETISGEIGVISENIGRFQRKEKIDELYAKNAIMNDSRVRLRKMPTIESETITLLEKNTQRYIFEHSDEKQKIGNNEFYWYRVLIPTGEIGWVYGEFLDFE